MHISEIHTKVSQIAPNSMDQTVDHILTWLQSRYQNTQNQRLGECSIWFQVCVLRILQRRRVHGVRTTLCAHNCTKNHASKMERLPIYFDWTDIKKIKNRVAQKNVFLSRNESIKQINDITYMIISNHFRYTIDCRLRLFFSPPRQRTAASPSFHSLTTSGISGLPSPPTATTAGILRIHHPSVPPDPRSGSTGRRQLLPDNHVGPSAAAPAAAATGPATTAAVIVAHNSSGWFSGAGNGPGKPADRFPVPAAADDRWLHGRSDRFPGHEPAAVRVQRGKLAVQPGHHVPSAAHTRHKRAVLKGHDDHQRGVQQTVRRRDLLKGT